MRRKLISTIIVLTFCLTSAFAASPAADNPTVKVSPNKQLSYSVDSTPLIQPMAWTGETAAIITNIELYDYGWLADKPDHFGILLKVTGYGSATATFNNKKVDYIITDYFINYGNTADGFYHLYDCGTIPNEGGTYDFNAFYRSSSDISKTRSFSTSFTFESV